MPESAQSYASGMKEQYDKEDSQGIAWRVTELLSVVENFLGYKRPMKEFRVCLIKWMLGAELTEHLADEPYAKPAKQQTNRCHAPAAKG